MPERSVAEISYEQMSPTLRAMLVYEPNGTFDVCDSQTLLDELRRTTPVVRWEHGIGFFGMDDIVAAGRNPALVSTNPETGSPLGMGSREPLIPLHVDGDVHRRYRKLLDPLLGPKQVAPLEGDIRKFADELIDGFIHHGEVELHDRFCVPLPSTIFLRVFGMPLDDLDFLIEMKDAILDPSGATTFEEKEELGRMAGDRLRARLYERLSERRAETARRDDLIGPFLTFEVDGDRLSDDEIVNIMHLFTIAGLDTVTSSLSCLFAWFATHPDQRRLVVAEPHRLLTVIEELMRFESPVPAGGHRWATEDTEVNGVTVQKGDIVFLCWASANLDPSTFEHPLEVDIDRAENRHIAFAAGIHRCLGSHLARLELRAAISQFHLRIPDYWVTDGDEIRYEFHGVRQAAHLPLTLAPAG